MTLVDRVRLPRRSHSPGKQVLRRIGAAMALVLFVAVVVLLSRDGYNDGGTGDEIGFLDALYYASVTVTTTGYGDISAVSTGARLAATILILPARILFLILVVGTTVEVLTDQSRQDLLTRRWRKKVNNHYIICGYGSTGQAVARDLLNRGVQPSEIVAVDVEPESIARATAAGMVGIVGDASQNKVLEQAGIATARAAVIVPNRDDTAVLVTLTAREMNPDVHIVAGGREQENLHLLRQGGADEVVDATSILGRLLGLGTYAPDAVEVVEDLLDAGTGLELVEVPVEVTDTGIRVPDGATLVAVIRDGRRLTAGEIKTSLLQPEDHLIVLRNTESSASD